ncbi:MAG TPA: hypothetical protein VGY48_12470 [Vicinamibacterales bacterium]|jgi:hypothetical protein|nr:hypothetical protein [Vicinamibacterales bacterium]
MRVKATREGLLGQKTASGFVIDPFVPFVALPSWRALQRFVRVTNPANGLSELAVVLDVGPWNTADVDYVFGGQRPQAESGIDTRGRPTNGAGIDLGERVWHLLKMTDNGDVDWTFVDGAGVST